VRETFYITNTNKNKKKKTNKKTFFLVANFIRRQKLK